MEFEKKIMELLLANPRTYNELIMCLVNKGLANMEYGYRNDRNFYFHRTCKQFYMDDIFIVSDEPSYLKEVMDQAEELNMLTGIFPKENWDTFRADSKWKTSIRRQFTKSAQSPMLTLDFTRLDKSHQSVVEKSESQESRENYAMTMEYGGECYGIIREHKLVSFLSISKLDYSEHLKLAEINWIYTEPSYRKQGYAAQLLNNVSNLLIQKHYLVTYHCAGTNEASAKTALKGGLEEESSELVYTKTC